MNKKIKALLKAILPDSVSTFIRKFKERKYSGTGVQCNMCQSTFKTFAPKGLVKRKNARCLNCGSLERHRLVWRYINEKTNFRSKAKVRLLHFAPEKNFLTIFSKLDHVEYVPCDLTPERYQKIAGGLMITEVDITAIPFPDDHFDVILCSHVLEHVPDDHLAMTELRRVMKKDGWGIFQVPIDYNRETTYEDFSITSEEGREKAFGRRDHVRYYGRDYPERLKKAGLKVNADHFVQGLSKEEAIRYGFDQSEIIYFCEKNG